MSFFKSFANFARKSNYRAMNRAEKFADSQEEYHRIVDEGAHGTRCCADCVFFSELAGDKHFYCHKHDFSYDFDEVRRNKIHYKRTCSDFCGKYPG